MEEPGRLQSMGLLESDTTERLHFHFSLSCIGEGKCNPLQCSCLENPRDREAWWAAIYGVAQSRTQLKRLSSSTEGALTFMIYCFHLEVKNIHASSFSVCVCVCVLVWECVCLQRERGQIRLKITKLVTHKYLGFLFFSFKFPPKNGHCFMITLTCKENREVVEIFTFPVLSIRNHLTRSWY